MTKNLNNQSGLAPIAIVLIIITVLAVGGGVWYYSEVKYKENPDEIYPFRTDEIILIKPETVSTFETKSGLKIKAASGQLLVYFYQGLYRGVPSDQEIEDFVKLVHGYNGYIVGQIPNSKIIQIIIEPKEALLKLKKELEDVSYIKLVAYNRVAGEDIFE